MLKIRNIQKRFGSQTTLKDLSLEIREGEFISLLGPSGCGKTTLLRIIAGLETADSGQILWQGKDLSSCPARERPFNMVFQRYALFPHLNVFENIAFGLRLKCLPENEIRGRVEESLALVGLAGFGPRHTETLSGGQAQRVAVARALVAHPKILLLDEPLSALDQKLRDQMQTELRLLQRRLGLTFILVTHDQEEALTMSDRIAVMNHGRIEQIGTPREIYAKPASLFCASFIGRMNRLRAKEVSRDGKQFRVEVMPNTVIDGFSRCSILEQTPHGQTKIDVYVRPEHLRVTALSSSFRPSLTPSEAAAARLSDTRLNRLPAMIADVVFRGTERDLLVRLHDDSGPETFLRVTTHAMHGNEWQPGHPVLLEFPAEETHLFLSEPE